MKIIISGALGHIGSYLIRRLPEYFLNNEFLLLDNFLTQRYCSLFDLNHNIKYKFLEADITQLDLSNLIEEGDVIIHLAAITDAANSFNKKEETEKNNFISTKKIADMCMKKKAKLIHISSTSVYGTQNDFVDESCSKDELKPQSPYAECKLKEENYLKNLSDLQFVTLRFGTIFGFSEGIRFHTAVNKFCWQASIGQPVTIWKTALNQNRPYLALVDALKAITHIIKNNLFNKEIYNVLTLNTSVNSIIEVIKKVIPNLKVELVDNVIMNQLSYHVLNDKFIKTNFVFSGNLELEIKNTLQKFTFKNI